MVYINFGTKYGKSRVEQEKNLRKDGMSSLSDEQFDKAKYLEKKLRSKYGTKDGFLRQTDMDRVK